ncbi:acetolactate synthase-1/2/3 large subunit [Kibdelosporangium banguiense]|uniref:Acetolactate synthase-1/2/3 large subunit n=1 Tax=Kibdelosporangium banguiense TaxID=1365924 RepID=A0ABS4TNP9_9PSEU|nr:thiamine pyrophosphate-dependent enzyme [Kibdelosporangium banguiense]MBP2326037.1 acetolactate synthase-1/2/3 large subunit [Kibdelosporangium banguiense]
MVDSTNVLTGVLEAKCSAAPLVVLAAGTGVERRGSAAFQELDQMSFIAPLVTWAHRVDHPNRVPAALQRAWLVAQHGVPGPVYVELPDHLLTAEIERAFPWRVNAETSMAYKSSVSSPALDAVRAARRPVLLVGGGARHRNDAHSIERFADRLGAALLVTASGRGSVDENHERFLGLSGLYLRPQAAELLRDSDLVIALGSRLEETATYGWPQLPVVQVNIAAEEFSAEFPGHTVVGDVAAVVAHWSSMMDTHEPDPGWLMRIAETRAAIVAEAKTETSVIAGLLTTLGDVLPEDRILVQENGLQDMWSYFFPFFTCPAEAGSIVPSEQTSLGFGAAAAGGVALAAPGRQVVAFVGDGAFAMVDADLETVARHGLGVLYVVLCNGGYGWLQAQLEQRRLNGERFEFAGGGFPPNRFDGLSQVHYTVLEDPGDCGPVLRHAVEVCAQGRVSVVYVPVELADRPPGLSEIDYSVPQ